MMENGIWIGLVVGGIISLAASVVANLLHPKVTSFLDSRKIVFNENRRRRSLQLYRVVTELNNGTRDRYIYMLRLATSAISMFMLAITAIFCGVVLLALSSPPTIPIVEGPMKSEMYYRIGALTFFLFFAYFGAFLVRSITLRYKTIANALDDYPAFEAAFKKKWGNDVI
jgi:hypothetical protein